MAGQGTVRSTRWPLSTQNGCESGHCTHLLPVAEEVVLENFRKTWQPPWPPSSTPQACLQSPVVSWGREPPRSAPGRGVLVPLKFRSTFSTEETDTPRPGGHCRHPGGRTGSSAGGVRGHLYTRSSGLTFPLAATPTWTPVDQHMCNLKTRCPHNYGSKIKVKASKQKTEHLWGELQTPSPLCPPAPPTVQPACVRDVPTGLPVDTNSGVRERSW